MTNGPDMPTPGGAGAPPPGSPVTPGAPLAPGGPVGAGGPLPGGAVIPGIPGPAGAGRPGGSPPTASPPRPTRPAPMAPPKVSDTYSGSITYLDLIARNKRRSRALVLMLMGLLVVVGGIFGGVLTAGGRGDDLVAGLISGGAVGLLVAVIVWLWAYYAGSSAVLRLAGAREIRPEDDPQLFNVVDEMRIAAGLPMPKVYLIDDPAMNAFATGRDPAHAAVAITAGLRQKLTRDELQAVMAHELAHIRHLDIRLMTLVATTVGLIVLVSDLFWRVLLRGGVRAAGRAHGGGGRGSSGAVVVVLVVVGVVLLLLALIVAPIIQFAISREREYLADAGAVELTRNPQALVDALTRLSNDDQPIMNGACRSTAHMYIVNPLRRMQRSHQQLDSPFASHPPLAKRIERIMALMR
jgi:heat shock protein HtpX